MEVPEIAPPEGPLEFAPEIAASKPKGRWRRRIAWTFVSILAVAAGAIGFAYTYITDSDTLAALARTQAPKFFPGSSLLLDKVQLRPLLGQVDLKGVTLAQRVDDRPFVTFRAPWIQVRCDLQALWRGRVEPSEVLIAQPTLRLTRRADGSWNFDGLLADPWPGSPQFRPTLRITKGRVLLVDGIGPETVLHDVELRFEPVDGPPGVYRFVGDAQGDTFGGLDVEGTLDTRDGRVVLDGGRLDGLTISESLTARLPEDLKAGWDEMGLTGGVVDVRVNRIALGGKGPTDLAIGLALRAGVLENPRLPFRLGGLSGSAEVADGRVTVKEVVGGYGKTQLRLDRAEFDLDDPEAGPIALSGSVSDLELDAEIRRQMPPDWRVVWDDFAPEPGGPLGRVSLAIQLARESPAALPDFTLKADLLDVAIRFRLFPFPVDHVRGRVSWSGRELKVEHLETLVGGKPLTARGTINDPGPLAVVALHFEAGAIPIETNGPFVAALPPEIRAQVEPFHPSGTVRGVADLARDPAEDPADEVGDVRVDAALEFNEGCSILWDDLPYPIEHLQGRLAIHPDHLRFSEVTGDNGLARIAASGRVDVLDGKTGAFATDVSLAAHHLRFDRQLHDALQPEWRATWDLLDPAGSCALAARVVVGYPDPARPDRTWLRVKVGPTDEARVILSLTPAPGTPGVEPGALIVLPAMRDVQGTFDYDNGLVTMSDVTFDFRQAPTSFRSGTVRLEPSGRFDLEVQDLSVRKLRMDPELRRIMPTMMADFAAKLDDGNTFTAGGDLGISWSGQDAEPAVCTWENALILFNDNSVAAGVPLRHIQGQISEIRGRSDGQSLGFEGLVELASFEVAGLQITDFRSPLKLGDGRSSLEDLSARLLGGELAGTLSVSLDATPEYSARLRLRGARLADLAGTLRGHQDFSGRLDVEMALDGSGSDSRRLVGGGSARLTEADLGKLPIFFRLLSPLNLRSESRAAFDTAALKFTVDDGQAILDPIKITGNTISLLGSGTLDPQGNVDLNFKPLYARDERLHIPGISDATREATGQLLVIRVHGPISGPKITPIPFPGPTRRLGEFARRVGERRARQ